MRDSDPETHFRYFRMDKQAFDLLLSKVKHHLESSPNHRYKITSGERSAVTLKILATGDSHSTVAASFRLGRSTVNKIVHRTTRAIWDCLNEEYVPAPTPEMWERNAREFGEIWQFPNCIGAIDGKHVTITTPDNQGSQYYNYKGHHSVVLMAIVDARYRFSAIDVGGYGRQSNGGTFGAWKMKDDLEKSALGIPEPKVLSNSDMSLPHVFVADAAFPLKENIMCPYPGENLSKEKRIFNYRLSRARRIVKNAFGILAMRWRIFLRCIEYQPDKVDHIILACVALHNFLCTFTTATRQYAPQHNMETDNQNGAWRGDPSVDKLLNAKDPPVRTRKPPRKAAETARDNFRDYFSSNGSVPWQEKMVYGKKIIVSESNSSDDADADDIRAWYNGHN
ncbi:hypothetical protein BV898_00360 [Hypsibius exemplaris]|uniref:DDE Tnp4 domain-containing protein n=1 Tax=Hypsibius exemplaris TaxID=2072580 RepID=A0A1W0XFU7_HYPEX|nr:hypothetical protein BV898_00360 [Hypsibius exemplaris]